MKLSIVVPVYNGEKHIEKCLKHLLNNKSDDIEIVVVNDGSKDRTPEILDSYDNIKVIHQVNQGVSVARNTGIENATGEYILFIDSDDLFIEECFDSIHKCLENKESRLICFSHIRENPNESIHVTYDIVEGNFNDLVYHHSLKTFQLNYCWGKLYKKDVIESHHIRFKKGIKYGEDQMFVNEYLMHVDHIEFINTPIVRYIVNGGSVMNNLTFDRVSNLQDIYESCLCLADSIELKDNDMFYDMYTHIMKNAVRYFMKSKQRKVKKVNYEEVKQFSKMPYYHDILSKVELNKLNIKDRLIFMIAKCNYKLQFMIYSVISLIK